MTTLLDYSGGRPSGAAVHNAGYTGVVRYIGVGSSGKRLTAAEYSDLKAAGLTVWYVVERGTTDAVGGYAAGLANGRAGLADLRAMGISDSASPIFCAMDAHVPAAGSFAEILDYVRGFADAVGHGRAGAYGFSDALSPVHRAGLVSCYWLCGTRPDAGTASWVNLWQDNTTTAVVGGVQCDVNRAYQPISTVEDDLTPEQDARLRNVEALLQDNHEQLCGQGSRAPGQFTGWPQYGGKTLIDGSAIVGDNVNKLLSAVKEIPLTVPAVTLTPDQLTVIEQSLVAALQAAGVPSAAQNAAATVALLGQKLGA